MLTAHRERVMDASERDLGVFSLRPLPLPVPEKRLPYFVQRCIFFCLFPRKSRRTCVTCVLTIHNLRQPRPHPGRETAGEGLSGRKVNTIYSMEDKQRGEMERDLQALRQDHP